MGLVLEAQIPENVVDQMKEALVDQWNLLDYSSLGRVPVTKEAGSQKTFTHSINQTQGQIDLSSTRKVKNLLRERNTSYQNKPYNSNNWDNEYNHHDRYYPKADAVFVTQNLRPAAKRFTGGPYLSWGSGSPLTRRKLAMKSCRLPSYLSDKGNGLSSSTRVPLRLFFVFSPRADSPVVSCCLGRGKDRLSYEAKWWSPRCRPKKYIIIFKKS